jgi:Helix-turn-helix family
MTSMYVNCQTAAVDDAELSKRARSLAAALEPVVGQVFFAPECHTAYAELGFAPSPATFNKVAMPDGAAYFTSRGSLLGQVQPDVIASAFGVFKPEVVVSGVRFGWSISDAPTIFAARREGATAQLERILGAADGDVARASERLERATDALDVPGRPLFAGLRAWWDDPTDRWTRLFHLGDMLRECRGDAHVAAWTAAGVDAVEIGLMTEAYIGLPLRTYIRTRAWNDAELDDAEARLRERGWLDDTGLTPPGREVRERIEVATDRQMRSAVAAIGDDLPELLGFLRPWGAAVREAGGYIGGPVDLWPNRGDH